jgi:hypothetical protein
MVTPQGNSFDLIPKTVSNLSRALRRLQSKTKLHESWFHSKQLPNSCLSQTQKKMNSGYAVRPAERLHPVTPPVERLVRLPNQLFNPGVDRILGAVGKGWEMWFIN